MNHVLLYAAWTGGAVWFIAAWWLVDRTVDDLAAWLTARRRRTRVQRARARTRHPAGRARKGTHR